MTPSPPAVADLDGHRTAATLNSALFDLGHRCDGGCTAAVDELGAQLWFSRRRSTRSGGYRASLVVVDARFYEGSRERSRQLMRAINDCVQPDGIRVSERRIDDSGVALALVRPSITPLHLVGLQS
jgi:hypothetical protein